MLKPLEVAQEAVQTLWKNKVLWLFGFFVVGGGGGVGQSFRNRAAATATEVPGWFWIVLVAAAVLAVAMIALKTVSEAALIDGVRRSRGGEPVTVRAGFQAGWRRFWPVLGVQLLTLVLALPLGLLVAVPVLLAVLHLGWPLVVAAAVAVGILAVPLLLTLQFVYEWAVRIAVLEEKPALAAMREGRRYLSGRVLDSVKLLVVTILGQLGGGIAAMAFVVPIALVGLGVYALFGLVPALVVGGVLLAPFAAALGGAMGAFRSAVWTVGFLDGRAAER